MTNFRTPDPVVVAGDSSRPYDLVVVGAGIAGLSAALSSASTSTSSSASTSTSTGCRVLVLDAHPLGGRARTTDHGGFLHNVGPHALYRTGALAALLARHRIAYSGGTPPAGGALAIRDGKASPLPARPFELLRTGLLGRADRLRLLTVLARVQRADPTRWVGRPVSEIAGGASDRVREFLEMFVRVSTYTDAPDVLDAGAAITQMQMALGPGVMYLDGGWASMIASMARSLEAVGGEVRTGVTVRMIEASGGDEPVVVDTDSGAVRATSVVLATGGPLVAQRLTGAVVRGADRITSPVTATVVDLALRHERPALAFALDAPLYMSAHAPAARLAPSGCGLVSIMRYHAPTSGVAVPVDGPADGPADGPVDGPVDDSSDGRVDRRVDGRTELRAFAHHAGITSADVVHERYLHRVVVTHGAPTALGGGLAGRPAVDALDRPGVYLAGDWVGAEGLLADAAAASGVAAALMAARRRASITA